jgi:hypothetical protein
MARIWKPKVAENSIPGRINIFQRCDGIHPAGFFLRAEGAPESIEAPAVVSLPSFSDNRKLYYGL